MQRQQATPCPLQASKTMSWEGKDKGGPLLSCTLWSPVCWKTRSDSNTLHWHRTLGSKCFHVFEILFPQKLEDSWNIQSVGAILKSTGFGLRLTWENSSPATYLLKDLWQFIPTTYSWVSLWMNPISPLRELYKETIWRHRDRGQHIPPPTAPILKEAKKKKKKKPSGCKQYKC